MNWRYETRRYLYVREEGSFAALSIEARMTAGYLLKLCDDKGKIFARKGEDIVDAICFRMQAGRGARRWIREAIGDLVDDGYLVRGDNWLRIRNFAPAQARPEAAEQDTAAITQPTSSEPAVIASPTGNEPDASAPPMSSEPAANEQRTGNEECVKAVESFECDPALPSVPSGPYVPISEIPPTPARDPAAPVTRTEPDNPANLIHVLGCMVRAAHPEVGLWAPGRFADRDLADFFGHISEAAGGRRPAAAIIRSKLEAFVAQPSEDGWTVKAFLDEFNGLGQRRRPGQSARASPPPPVTVGHVRAEAFRHPTGKQEI